MLRHTCEKSCLLVNALPSFENGLLLDSGNFSLLKRRYGLKTPQTIDSQCIRDLAHLGNRNTVPLTSKCTQTRGLTARYSGVPAGP